MTPTFQTDQFWEIALFGFPLLESFKDTWMWGCLWKPGVSWWASLCHTSWSLWWSDRCEEDVHWLCWEKHKDNSEKLSEGAFPMFMLCSTWTEGGVTVSGAHKSLKLKPLTWKTEAIDWFELQVFQSVHVLCTITRAKSNSPVTALARICLCRRSDGTETTQTSCEACQSSLTIITHWVPPFYLSSQRLNYQRVIAHFHRWLDKFTQIHSNHCGEGLQPF